MMLICKLNFNFKDRKNVHDKFALRLGSLVVKEEAFHDLKFMVIQSCSENSEVVLVGLMSDDNVRL